MIDIREDWAIQQLGEHFKNHGHQIRLVGGAVRDILLNEIPKDYDFATTATPEQMLTMTDQGWKVIPTGIDHGTVTFMSIAGSFEVTTLRKDVETDGRHAKVEWTDSWKEDAARRDFTINAMSMDLDGEVHDYFDGLTDIQTPLTIKFVGLPFDRIREDGLRIIRYFRFLARYKGHRNYDSFNACIKYKDGLSKVSVERVWQEIKKAAFFYDSFDDFIRDIIYYDILQYVGFNFPKNKSERHLTRLGKYIYMYPEFAIGALLYPGEAENFCKIFKLSTNETKRMLWFSNNKDKSWGTHEVQDLIIDGVDRDWVKVMVQYHNYLGSAVDVDSIQKVEFPVSGADLMQRGMKQGRELGMLLNDMKIRWKESRYSLTKEQLLASLNI